MATGIVKRHSRRCPATAGGKCGCSPSYRASVSVKRDGAFTKVQKTFGREAEAKAWRADAQVAANRGELRAAAGDRRTLATALDEWLADLDADRVTPRGRSAYKPSTKRSYHQHVEKYIKPHRIGSVRVTEVRSEDVQALADALLKGDLRPGTVANVLCPLQAFYRRLVKRKAVAVNPAIDLDLPSAQRERPARIASRDEAAALIAALPASERPLWAAAFYAGLRRGELQALRWCDVDLAKGLIRVERTWDQVEGPIPPKSEAGRRKVPLLAILRDYLDEHKLRSERDGDALVFGRTASRAFAPMSVGKAAKRAWAEAKLDPLTLHECRHTYASMLIDAGANPKAIQVYMGHSKIQVTFDTYGHLIPGSHDEVRDRMDAYLESVAPNPDAASPIRQSLSRRALA